MHNYREHSVYYLGWPKPRENTTRVALSEHTKNSFNIKYAFLLPGPVEKLLTKTVTGRTLNSGLICFSPLPLRCLLTFFFVLLLPNRQLWR